MNPTLCCSRCRENKAPEEFVRHTGNRGGRASWCKDCVREQRGFRKRLVIVNGRKLCPCCREWKPVEQYAMRSDRPDLPRSMCKACVSASEQASGAKKWRHKLRRYGITAAEYNRLVATQGGHCGLCGGDPDGRGLVVDHDHATGVVRALLCNRCNAGIGMFRESPDLLNLAISYLQRFRPAVVTP